MRVKEPNDTSRTEEASELAKADKAPCANELPEGAHAVNKDFAAHDIREGRVVRLTRQTAKALDSTPVADVVSKLPSDSDGNSTRQQSARRC